LFADKKGDVAFSVLRIPAELLPRIGSNIGFTGYDEYPLTIIDNKECTLILEGSVYNIEKDSLEQTLTTLAEAQIGSDTTRDEKLKQFLLAAEGEFVIIIYDKAKKRMILANDIMGRLPLYCFQDAESLIVSRELKFILPFLPLVKFNKNGILEYLLYGFPFEENTFVETVSFFPAATWVRFDLVSGESIRESYHSMNFDVRTQTGDRKKLAADMCRIFMDGMSRRAAWVDKNRTIVSLSGGFDSRATLAGMKKLGLCPTAVTAQSEEEGAAREVAGFMCAEVYAIPQGHVETERSFAEIVFLKDGLDCHPNLAQLYQNLKELRDEFGGDVVYFTGIYGGEITRHSHITAGLSSLDSLAHYLLNANDSYKYSTEKVAAILQVPQKEIKEHLEQYLKKLPEENICRKYARFRHEYDTRFAGEAEDRNRYYFWTISPFFSFPFFTYCMSIDEKSKTSWLFRDFLFALDPNTCKAKYFNYGLPLNHPAVLWCLAIAEGMVRHVWVKNSSQTDQMADENLQTDFLTTFC
jgi:asparagine synthase (glutamine-hydrolysing)